MAGLCRHFLRGSFVVGLAGLLAGCPRTSVPPPPATPLPEISTPVPIPTPTPPPYVPNKKLEVGKIFNGMQIRTTVETEVGTTTSADRVKPEAYAVDLKVRVTVPQPHQDFEALSRLNAQLGTALPALPKMLETAQVSPVFDHLYRLKVTNIQNNILRLDNLISKHNFYDCETILNLEHPETKRKAVLLQADMDVDTDGSDADRVPEIDGSSVTFQPFTSYKWGKKTKQVNSFITGRQARLKQAQSEQAIGGQSAARQAELKATVTRLKDEISDLGKYSYLLGASDPYVVLPGTMFAARNRSAFAPAVGDYCLVIAGDTLYPAVVGDVGPMNVLGEASLRICKELSAKADSNNRAASDLKVTYLFFPGSADKPFDVPNLERWRARCETLLNEIGGTQGKLFVWEDLTKPKPPPATPVPPAIPAVTPDAPTEVTATPAAVTPSATPKASPASKAGA